MATTALLVEIVVMGLLTLAALALDAFYITKPYSPEICRLIQSYKPDGSFGALFILALSYPMGWAINSLSYVIYRGHYAKIGERTFPNNYSPEHGFLMQRASDYSSRLLVEHFAMVRIDRSFFLILWMLIPASGLNPWYKVTCPVLAVFICLFAYMAHKAYSNYKKLSRAVHSAILEEDLIEMIKKLV